MTAAHLRDRYLQDSINTASPARLLVMLYDRLILDLTQGEEALREGDRDAAHERITHAQEIVLELRVTLDLEAWDGAPGLANLYGFILTELIGANIAKSPERVAGCRTLLEPLRDAWREAAVAAK
ncbi:flagellar biosynthesis protein FliS [Actinoplanes sp. SE50]|uniref:flagellar export chaperone FliS n=1 Tax=unclassified Actinoplanes TaxID=2626549 RepID=UPI00023EDEE4|nr:MULTISPECIES: flagellar export chaperone FliS [unclassified Actinoplanes]AEV88779.1 Flagellar protein fliS [Actinoplanes sp. SE50/110]ATO87185.1 flagellar biosynthesis protein FliS [Actinoplanes sp. SE50]SLM04603.1 flagellar export chaperone FliS [Actinoplanes sp. SE50/110]